MSENVDMDRVYGIESSHNPKAHNVGEDARGLGQIRPIVLEEWNQRNPEDVHTAEDLFNPDINKKISDWYLNKRIPQMLNYFGIPDTIDNRLISYNAGIKTLVDNLPLPTITQDYLKKYESGIGTLKE